MEYTKALARAVVIGGAKAIRTGGYEEIRAIRSTVSVPIIGFFKLELPDYSKVRVTPTFESARRIAQAGADLISMEATGRARPDGLSDEEMMRKIKQELGKPVIADISTFEEGVAAERAGADCVAMTLAGYTPQSKPAHYFDFELLQALVKQLKVPVIAEGHINTPEEAQLAITYGAFAVVVGSMIIRPQLITRRFVNAIQYLDSDSSPEIVSRRTKT